MYTENYNASTRNGTYGGTLLAILLQVSLPGLLNTVIIAAIGAATSFFVSVALRYISKKIFGSRPEKSMTNNSEKIFKEPE